MSTLLIGHHEVSLEDVYEVATQGRKVQVDPKAKQKIKASNEFLRSEIKAEKTMYGVNTGFGSLASVRIADDDIEKLQVKILRSHASGVGEYLKDEYVRAMLLLRANALSWGYSGVRLELVQAILDLLNHGIYPLVPSQGSVGASGDLAPLSHLALVLIGEGQARVKGKVMSGAQALKQAGLKPQRLQAKEGLALINGTQFMTALGVLTLLESERLCNRADFIGAISLEALRGSFRPFDHKIHLLRPHPGQKEVARRLSKILHPSGKTSEIAKSHKNCNRVQDPYSLRCMPQVHGATRDTLQFVRSVLEKEVNSVTDNPLVFAKEKQVLSGGNFHGQIVAIALDALAIAIAELGSISEERLAKMVNPATSELPACRLRP